MSKAAGMLRRGAAETRAKKARANAGMAALTTGMTVRDSAKAAAHAAAGLAHTVRDEATERAGELGEATRRSREQAMLRMGDWVMTPPVAERLGIRTRTRRIGVMGVLLGLAAGLAAGMMLGRRAGAAVQPEASWQDPESLAPPLGRGQIDPQGVADAQARAAGDSHTSVTA